MMVPLLEAGEKEAPAAEVSPFPWLNPALEAGLKADPQPCATEAANGLRPTLIIGFGEAGQWVLTHIKNTLLDRMEAWPANVRLLLVDFEDKSGGRDPLKRQICFAGRSLNAEEMVIMRPRFSEIDGEIEHELRQLQSRWAPSDRSRLHENWHHRWWIGNRAGYYGRCGGRMAIFWDLQQREGGGELERKLQDALISFGDKPVEAILVASGTDEACSGMIWDIGHLLRVLPGVHHYPSPISLFLTFLQTHDWDNGLQVAAAVLREMDRLSYAAVTPYHYLKGTPSERFWLVSPGEKQPFDCCYLLADKSGQRSIDLSDTAPEYGLFPLAADAVVTLMDSRLGRHFADQWRNVWRHAHDKQRDNHRCMVSSMGSFTFKLPMRDLRRAIEYRLLLDLLFGEGITACLEASADDSSGSEEEVGLLKLQSQQGFLRTTASVWRRPPKEGTSTHWEQEVEEFLRGQAEPPLLHGHPLLRAMAEAWKSSTWPDSPDPQIWNEAAIAGAKQVFRQNLQQKLNLLLNGVPNTRDVLLAKTARFPETLDFLATLRKALETGIPPLPKPHIRALNRSLRERYYDLSTVCVRMAAQAEEELNSWVECLARGVALESAAQPATQQLQLISLSDAGAEGPEAMQPDTLREILHVGLEIARRHLDEERKVAMRHTFLKPEELELPFYREHITRSLKEQTIQQILWRWEFAPDGQPSLWLMALGPKHMGMTPEGWQQHARSRQQMAELADDLLDLAQALSRQVIETLDFKDKMHRASWPMQPNVQEALNRQGLVMLGVSGQDSAVAPFRYGAAVSWPGGNQWQADWGKAPEEPIVNQGPGGDPYSSTILEALPPVYVDNTDLWQRSVGLLQDESLSMAPPYSPAARWHVLPPEQVAAEYEAKRYSGVGSVAKVLFHPLFVRLLEDEDLARYFALGYLSGLLDQLKEQDYYWLKRGRKGRLKLKGRMNYIPQLVQAMEAFTILVPWTREDGEQLVGWRRQELLKKLSREISERWQQMKQDHGSLDEMVDALRQERIAPLMRSHDRLERDLAAFLEAVLMEYQPY